MGSRKPPKLQDLDLQRELQNEASAMAPPDWLPTDLFPSLFLAAAVGGHTEIVKAMMWCWPFIWLPLGALLKYPYTQQDILMAAMDGFDSLRARNVPPRRSKLRVLDLTLNPDTNVWKVCSVPSSDDTLSTQPRAMTHQGKDFRAGETSQPLASMVLITDLCFLETGQDELLTCLIERVQQGRGLPPLGCRKLEFIGLPELPVIEGVLHEVQLDSVQEVVLHCRWDLKTLKWFVPYLAHFTQLSTLHLSGIILDPLGSCSREEVEKLLEELTSQLLSLHQLRHLILESVYFIDEQLDQMLRCLPAPLKTLTLKYCVPVDSDMFSLCTSPSTRSLRFLDLSGVFKAALRHEFLPSLLERVSATLTYLNLADCGINDSELTALQPALGQCSQLTTLLLGGNSVSMAVLQDLLEHTWPLCNFCFVALPVPQHCYRDHGGPVYLSTLSEALRELEMTLQAYGPLSVKFSPSTGKSTWDEIIIHV